MTGKKQVCPLKQSAARARPKRYKGDKRTRGEYLKDGKILQGCKSEKRSPIILLQHPILYTSIYSAGQVNAILGFQCTHSLGTWLSGIVAKQETKPAKHLSSPHIHHLRASKCHAFSREASQSAGTMAHH